MESSITMLVRIKPQQATNIAGFSLIKITYAFVITIYVFSIFIAIIYFVGMTKWARLVGGSDIRPRDKTLGSLTHTRILITTFFLILMIPIACYIVSQASSYASQRRSGTVKSLTELIRKSSNVGYREGSFIRNLLLKQGFSESKLISLKSEEDIVNKLSKGTLEGGVDAVVGDSPHLKLLQAKYCDTFTLVPTTNLLATGFGFAFGKDSTLTKEVSNGILKIVDDGDLVKIQEKTIGKLETCDDPNANVDVGSAFLSSNHKWILFVGVILVALFILFSIASLY